MGAGEEFQRSTAMTVDLLSRSLRGFWIAAMERLAAALWLAVILRRGEETERLVPIRVTSEARKRPAGPPAHRH
jgi:hypothetical protein